MLQEISHGETSNRCSYTHRTSSLIVDCGNVGPYGRPDAEFLDSGDADPYGDPSTYAQKMKYPVGSSALPGPINGRHQSIASLLPVRA